MTSAAHESVSVLMPAYNLESSIAANVERVYQVVGKWPEAQIVVIDDGSEDSTRKEAERAAAPIAVALVVGYEDNRGKGAALKEGSRHATGETVVFLDADLDLPPEQLPGFLAAFEQTGADALTGAKRSSMSAGRYPLARRLLSLLFALTNRVLFRLPVAETQTGLKAFRRTTLEPAISALETQGYAFDLELLVRIHKAGGQLAETPVTLAEGSAGRVSLKVLVLMARDTLRIWIKSLRWNR